jgi:hypothetical protein
MNPAMQPAFIQFNFFVKATESTLIHISDDHVTEPFLN